MSGSPGRKRLSLVMGTVVLLVSAIQLPVAAAKTRTRLSLSVFPEKVDSGGTVLFFGKLASKKKACIRKQAVEIRSAGSAVATARTDKRGNYSFAQVVHVPASFQVAYKGSKRCKASTTPARAVEVFELPPPTLQGPETDPASSHIPDAPFPNVRAGDLALDEQTGALVSVTEFLISFTSDADVGEVNALLASIGSDIVGGNPDAEWILVRLRQARSPGELLALVEELDANPLVDLVSPEIALEGDRVPGPNREVDPPGPATSQAWKWGTLGGNWALEAIRAPQAWNLLDELSRRQTQPSPVGVIDSAFDPTHPDLSGKFTLETLGGRNPNPPITATSPFALDHGTETVSVITARFHNYSFIDGVAPFPEDDNGSLGGVVGVPVNQGPLTAEEAAECKALGNDPAACGAIYYSNRMADDFLRFRRGHPEIKIFSMSLGIGFDECAPLKSLQWKAQGIGSTQEERTAAQQIVGRAGATFARAMPDINSENGVLLFASAGNASDLDGSIYPPTKTPEYLKRCPPSQYPDYQDPGPVNIPAIWSSPMCHAAAFSEPGILCVEAARNVADYPRANFSDGGGHLAAPGERMSALLPVSRGLVKYPVRGTSMAAPLAAGAAAWLHALANRSGATPMSVAQLREYLVEGRRLADGSYERYVRPSLQFPTGPNSQIPLHIRTDMIDLFLAVMGLDERNGDKALQRALVDVDDGSLLDGNARRDHDDEDNDGIREELYPLGIVHADKLRGDGHVDMKDFRAFRDAMLDQMLRNKQLQPGQVLLDGAADHFKRDLNLDGCVETRVPDPPHPDPPIPPGRNCKTAQFKDPLGGTQLLETYFSRYDFNGDGFLNGRTVNPATLNTLKPFKTDPTTECTDLNTPVGCLRDIDVLADPDIWEETQENITAGGGGGAAPCLGNRWQPSADLLADNFGAGSAAPDTLVDYLLSADLHFDIGKDPTGDIDQVYIDVDVELPDGNGVDDDADGKVDEAFENSVRRCLAIGPAGGKTILTVPLYTRSLLVTVLGVDDEVDANGDLTPDPYHFRRTAELRYGADEVFEVKP